ncbi:MAG: hypothetical protein DRN12_01665 [Thermoplasmata archaeon]|nr:MAG: hypothetical protein DRN12_01665 [Thermoplasmata archaeon]
MNKKILLEYKMSEQVTFPDPDPITLERPSIKKYIGYLKFFGPGAIVASITIGQGQLILGPQIGAWAGYTLLWLITLNIGSYIIAYVSCRFTLISGIGVMDLFSVKTKHGWMNWLFIVIMIIFIPIFTASIVTSLGQTLQWIFGRGHYLLWGILFCIFAAFLALVGRYKLLEYSQAFFVAVLAIGALITLISLKPDLIKIIPHFFTIWDAPSDFPSWVYNDYPSVTKTPISLYMLGYLGTLTITIITLIGYTGWLKVKKWGIFKNEDNPEEFSQQLFKYFKRDGKINYLPSDGKIKPLLKPIAVDLFIAFIIVSLVSAAYMIVGAILLADNHILPEDTRLVQNQLIIFTYLANWLKPLFQISVFFALFGTVYSGFEAATRMLYETVGNLSPRIRKMPYKRFMFYLLVYLLVTGIPLAIMMYYGLSVLLMLSLTLMFVGVIGVILYGIGVVSITQKVLPKQYALGRIGIAISIIGIILLLIPFIYLL